MNAVFPIQFKFSHVKSHLTLNKHFALLKSTMNKLREHPSSYLAQAMAWFITSANITCLASSVSEWSLVYIVWNFSMVVARRLFISSCFF